MKIRVLGFALAAALVGFAANAFAQSTGSAAADAPPGQTARMSETSDGAQAGKRLFRADGCWECHGTVGQGGGISGPRIVPMSLPYDAFIYQLRTPRDQMPPFEAKVVSDKDAADIYSFLKSIPKESGAADIPLLND